MRLPLVILLAGKLESVHLCKMEKKPVGLQGTSCTQCWQQVLLYDRSTSDSVFNATNLSRELNTCQRQLVITLSDSESGLSVDMQVVYVRVVPRLCRDDSLYVNSNRKPTFSDYATMYTMVKVCWQKEKTSSVVCLLHGYVFDYSYVTIAWGIAN